MVARSRLLSLIQTAAWKQLGEALDDSPENLPYEDEKGRNLLHLACMLSRRRRRSVESNDLIKTVQILLERGLNIDTPAFCRGDWHATPLWHAVSRGENPTLARFLLEQECDPNHCLWSAVFQNSAEVVGLLIDHGADVDPVYEDGTTPLSTAIRGGHLGAARELLERGANLNFQADDGRTALHQGLQSSDAAPVVLLLEHGARTDIEDNEQRTAGQMLLRKRSPAFRALAKQYLKSES